MRAPVAVLHGALATVAIVLLQCGGKIVPTADEGVGCGSSDGDCLPDPGVFCTGASHGCLCPQGETPQSTDPRLTCQGPIASGTRSAYCCTE